MCSLGVFGVCAFCVYLLYVLVAETKEYFGDEGDEPSPRRGHVLYWLVGFKHYALYWCIGLKEYTPLWECNERVASTRQRRSGLYEATIRLLRFRSMCCICLLP